MKKFLLGTFAGLSLGMLFAPEKGEKLRKKLAKSDDKLRDFGKEMLTAGKDASEEVKKFLDSKEAKEFFAKGKENFSELMTAGKDLSAKGKKELAEVIQKVKGQENILEQIKDFFGNKK